jgi:hypothetical protein
VKIIATPFNCYIKFISCIQSYTAFLEILLKLVAFANIIGSKFLFMAIWQRLPQEQSGKYFFSGKIININWSVTADIQLPETLILFSILRKMAEKANGLHAVQAFVHSKDSSKKLYFVDNLSNDMIASGKFKEDENYCTVMWIMSFN